MLLFRWELVRVMKINYYYYNSAITVVFIKVQWNPENTNNNVVAVLSGMLKFHDLRVT